MTQIRRLSFDLTGLPPDAEEAGKFALGHGESDYEQLVDKLLASPHFGERMAMYWLDQVRFADTIGYHSDNPRDITPYRDYVINSFNQNKSFDQFTIEQLAGDLLPNATLWQKVASAYNRLNMTTEEGGAQAKEYEAKYAADRVRNISSVWMAGTMGCCECHDHKFDPFSTKDFYSMAAFFADVKESAVGKREAGMLVPSPEQERQLSALDEQVAALKKRLETATPELAAAQAQWEASFTTQPAQWQIPAVVSAESNAGAVMKIDKEHSILATGKTAEKDTYKIVFRPNLKGITGLRLEALPDPSLPKNGPGRAKDGQFVVSSIAVELGGAKPVAVTLKNAGATLTGKGFDVASVISKQKGPGWSAGEQTGQENFAVFETEKDTDVPGDETIAVTLVCAAGKDKTLGRFRLAFSTAARPLHADRSKSPPKEVAAVMAVESNKRTEPQKQTLAAFYRSIAPLLEGTRAELAQREKEKAAMVKDIPSTLVTVADSPRVVRIKPRGNWMDDSGEIVSPAVPHFLPPLNTNGKRATRLDLARWIVSSDNPLTARVFANRMWKLFFGQGISKSLDDLGAQGEWPSHPELLDWLAVDFREHGWDVKRLIKQIVMSRTYRQTSVPSKEMKERDPYNRLLARQSRFRLDAEMVRDNALAVSGLLSTRVGGESDKPYQPEGYWQFLNFPTRTYAHDHDEKEYRRGLYTFWQRTFLHPSLAAFDAPTREECTCERTRSNTPQQALILLNDPTYVEAARVFAARIVKDGGTTTQAKLEWTFRQALSRPPSSDEEKMLLTLHDRHLEDYKKDPAAAEKLVHAGEAPFPAGIDLPEMAAWTSVARVILNLHEAITRF